MWTSGGSVMVPRRHWWLLALFGRTFAPYSAPPGHHGIQAHSYFRYARTAPVPTSNMHAKLHIGRGRNQRRPKARAGEARRAWTSCGTTPGGSGWPVCRERRRRQHRKGSLRRRSSRHFSAPRRCRRRRHGHRRATNETHQLPGSTRSLHRQCRALTAPRSR